MWSASRRESRRSSRRSLEEIGNDEAREQLLDIFREAADYWSDRKVAFRCFYSFSVARVPSAEKLGASPEGIELLEEGEKMPTDKLVDVSPMALRMSSPFNAGYWLTAA